MWAVNMIHSSGVWWNSEYSIFIWCLHSFLVKDILYKTAHSQIVLFHRCFFLLPETLFSVIAIGQYFLRNVFIYQTGESQYTPLPALHYIVSTCVNVCLLDWTVLVKARLVWKEERKYTTWILLSLCAVIDVFLYCLKNNNFVSWRFVCMNNIYLSEKEKKITIFQWGKKNKHYSKRKQVHYSYPIGKFLFFLFHKVWFHKRSNI